MLSIIFWFLLTVSGLWVSIFVLMLSSADYSVADNTWEREEHLPEEVVTSFESRYVDPLCAEEYKERLVLLFEGALKSPLGCYETLTMRHDVVRSLFPGMDFHFEGFWD